MVGSSKNRGKGVHKTPTGQELCPATHGIQGLVRSSLQGWRGVGPRQLVVSE